MFPGPDERHAAATCIEALEMSGFPGVPRDGFMSRRRNDTAISVVLICVACGLRTVHPRDLGPQLSGALPTAVADVRGDDWAGPGIHGDPDPLLVRPFPNEAPHLIGFRFQLPDHHVGWTDRQLDVSVLGTGGKAFHHTAQEPRETDAHRPADTT
jgi:hypothetical protein